MAFTLVQCGTALKLVNTSGTVTALTLPTGITLDDTKVPRFAVFDNYVVMVNTPSRPITIDSKGVVRPLSLLPPAGSTVLTNASGGSLSGTYTAKVTFILLDEAGNLISESNYSPASNSQAVSTEWLKATSVPVSFDTISGRRLYRTSTLGSTYFEWVDIDGNIVTTVQDDLSDAGLALTAAPTLGTAPHLSMIAEWRGRLWGVSTEQPDNVRYTETGILYAWPEDNLIVIPPIGADRTGASGLIPRREALGVGRLNQLLQIVGSATENSDGDTDLDTVILSRQLGVLSQDSVAVYRDTAYFLWYDGVYQWDGEGIRCISDGQGGKGNVRSWFTTDSYFNRSRFQFSFAYIDPVRFKYVLYLTSADGTVENRWVEYDLNEGTWWGPHKTDAFTPTAGFVVFNASNIRVPLIGSSSGYLYQQTETRTDGTATAIDLNVHGKYFDLNEPTYQKYFGELSMYGKPKTSGTLTIQARVGDSPFDDDTAVSNTFLYDMTKARQRLGRVGTGKWAQLEYHNSTVGEDVELFGFEVDPVNVIGRR